MISTFESIVPKYEQEEIREIVSSLLLLSESDRALILSNVNILKARMDLEKVREVKDTHE